MNSIAQELVDAAESAGPDKGVLLLKAANAMARMDFALKLAKTLLERTGNFDTPISSEKPNGPTIGGYIERALAD
jgi:hypothetical protein